MHHVTCPKCGETVRAENINIQQMVAVCQNCDTVFQFDTPNETVKAKRRKVKKPDGLSIEETAKQLTIDFRTNFRLDQDATFINSITIGTMFSLMSIFLADEAPTLLPFIFVLVAVSAFYRLALRVYNHTRIEMDDVSIRVSRQPIPNLFAQDHIVNLSGVVSIHTQETEISVKEAYDTPRYRVWAETVDGTKRTIVNDVTEEYAYFIAQQLDEYLHSEVDAINTFRLDDNYLIDDEEAVDLQTMLEAHQETDQR